MKQRNYYRVAALLLAVMMTLGLAACGGSGSGGKVDQPQKNDHSANTVWNGLWVGEDEVLQIMSDESIALLFYVETDGFYKGAQNNFDEVYSYSYTIDGNVLKLKNGYAADEGVAPETMELTMNGDRLVSGDKVYIKFTETSGSGQTQQPSVSEPAVQSEPAVTDPPVVSTSISGIWQDGPGIFVFYNDFALAYVFGSGDDGDLRFAYLKNLYDCSYTLSGNTLSLSVFEMDGTPVHSGEFALDGNTLSNGQDSMVKVSGNTGTEGDLAGTWHCMGDEYQFGALTGMQLQFYNDGTYRMSQEDGSGQEGGTYRLTSQYDLPAVTLCDENGNVIGTYCYEFLENDLLMIYVYDVDFGGYVFYRAS